MSPTKSIDMLIQERDDAIAEVDYFKEKLTRMKAGVVWEGTGVWIDGAIRWDGKPYATIVWSSEEERGQRVRVTVRLEGEDADK